MADNASLARPYAKALFELAQETSAFDSWSSSLTLISAVADNEDFTALSNDPRVSADQLTQLLTDVCKDQLPEGGANFISLLVQNNRLTAVADIEAQFNELVAKAQQAVTAQVQTAIALSDEQKASLSSALEKRLGLKVSLEETIVPELIGGAIVKAGDLVIDGSAKGRIEKLATTLAR